MSTAFPCLFACFVAKSRHIASLTTHCMPYDTLHALILCDVLLPYDTLHALRHIACLHPLLHMIQSSLWKKHSRCYRALERMSSPTQGTRLHKCGHSDRWTTPSPRCLDAVERRSRETQCNATKGLPSPSKQAKSSPVHSRPTAPLHTPPQWRRSAPVHTPPHHPWCDGRCRVSASLLP